MKFKPIIYNRIYLISNTGVVKNSITGQILSQNITKEGYSRVTIRDYLHRPLKLLVHRLVAIAFCENPNNYDIVNHKDEDKLNNNASNLEWCTQKYNRNYGNANLKLARKISIPIVMIKNNIKSIYRSCEIASKYHNIPRQSISAVVNKKRNSVYGFVFRKADDKEIELLGDIDYLEVLI